MKFKTFLKKVWDCFYKLILNLFCRNAWGWAHLLTATLISTIAWKFLPFNYANHLLGLKLTFALALGWELYEYYFEIARKGLKVEDIYSTKKHYIEDTIGDILFAFIGFYIGLIGKI